MKRNAPLPQPVDTSIAELTRCQGTRYSVVPMNTGEENAPVADDTDASPLLSLDLELAPAWARKAPEIHHQRFADDPRGGADDGRRSGGNRDFLNAAVNWLCDRPLLVSGIEPRPVTDFHLQLTRHQQRQLAWLLLGALPGGVLFFGWLVWLVRRK